MGYWFHTLILEKQLLTSPRVKQSRFIIVCHLLTCWPSEYPHRLSLARKLKRRHVIIAVLYSLDPVWGGGSAHRDEVRAFSLINPNPLALPYQLAERAPPSTFARA